MLKVYKASAGSGKTFQLVVEYLKLLLLNPNNYKHILAVTFTNKATNEMKSRILEQLYVLASNRESAYIQSLQDNGNINVEEIRKRARLILKNILHDYNRFSINTIDSFTQKVIKSFNRELGIAPNFAVEMDGSMILEEATERMLAKIDKNKKLLKWLKEFSKEKIQDNKSQRIEYDIKALGYELFKENFQVFFPENGESVYSRENLSAFAKDLNKIKTSFELQLKIKGQAAFQSLIKSGFSIDDFSNKKGGIAGYIKNIAEGQVKEPGVRVLAAENDIEKWYTKKHKNATEIHHLIETTLHVLLLEILTYYRNNIRQYNTTLVVLKQLRMLGILSDLKDEIKTVLHEKGVLQISDSNLLLSKIIGQSESPFVYEKIGNFYKYFMLDEFQDTSGLQWKNFKPLIVNSLAEGQNNLIVGDVKQSIYRWRNSDWNILAEEIHNDFHKEQIDEHTLEKNWRSDKNIIGFINAIIGSLKDSFEKYLFNGIDDSNKLYKEKFRNIYGSFEQKPGKSTVKNEGFAAVHFLPVEDFQTDSIALLIEQVKQIQDNGIKASEIAILIRKNREGTQIIEKFLFAAKQKENRAYNLSMLSNESLFLHASKGVQFVISVLELIVDPNNPICKVTLLQLWQQWLKPEIEKNEYENNKISGTSLQKFNLLDSWQISNNFEEIFQEELGIKLEEARKKVLLTSLDESITQISSLFGLFNLSSELPFLQTLIDKAGELKTSLSNDLSNLLFWWNEKGFKTSVSVNEDIDAIRLLTVHKAKGLEFKAVLIPFLNWDTSWSSSFAPILWCKTKSEPFNRFPLLPVKASSILANSDFINEYFEEKTSNYIDALNLVYVAFTRAKSVLIIHCPEVKETRSQNPNSGKPVHFLLNKALLKISENETFQNCWIHDENKFEFGNIPTTIEKEKVSNSQNLTSYKFRDFSEKIHLRLSAEDFLINDEKNNSIKNTGKIIHEILAEIEGPKDIEKACLKALNSGTINKSEYVVIKEKIESNFENPTIHNWFNGPYKVLNERDLLSKEKIHRPDRVMVSGDYALVVDYKTGDKKSENYKSQVKRYAKLLKATGFKNVIAYLWYLNLNEVEKVCEL